MSNSIEKLAKEAERLAKNLQGNPFPEFDQIAKDIKDRQDNSIAMEFTRCIGELLKKNGITPKIKQYGCDFYGENSFSSKYGVIVDELDFTEHDKVFEDKIAELDRMRKVWLDKAVEWQQENEKLKQRIAELEQSRSEWIDKAVEWQQKCEKLESKETESVNEMPDSITIDGYKCKIIKTESGLYISRDEIYSIIDKEKEPIKQKCKELENRHQSDCIEINRLNTTIDVLIHKVEYLRQFAGLE